MTENEPATVLIVDDDEAVHRHVTAYVGRDYRLLHAFSGYGARRWMLAAEVDVVILDLGLPDVPGLELLGELGSQAPAPSVVVLSAEDPRRFARAALEGGAVAYLEKTYEGFRQLDAIVRSALRARGLTPRS